jgi:hypothetical protein
MEHVLNEQEWLEYSDGGLAANVRARAGAHLETCATCRETVSGLFTWRNLLAAEGTALRDAMGLPECDLDRMLAQSLARIAAAEPATAESAAARRTTREAISLLCALMEPVFGRRGVRAAVDMILDQVAPDEGGAVAPGAWSFFIESLSGNIAAVFGLSAGRLVTKVGMALAVEL